MSIEPNTRSSLEESLSRLIQLSIKVLNNYFVAIDRLFDGKIRVRLNYSGYSIDDRLQKIDLARQNLLEGLSALEDLKSQAEENRTALQAALSKIDEIEARKQIAQTELNTYRAAANLDAASLKKVLDIPTPSKIWRERAYGLFTGVLASILAAAIWSIFN